MIVKDHKFWQFSQINFITSVTFFFPSFPFRNVELPSLFCSSFSMTFGGLFLSFDREYRSPQQHQVAEEIQRRSTSDFHHYLWAAAAEPHVDFILKHFPLKLRSCFISYLLVLFRQDFTTHTPSFWPDVPFQEANICKWPNRQLGYSVDFTLAGFEIKTNILSFERSGH